MKSRKRILIIDDVSQEAPIRSLKSKMRKELELVCEEIITKRPELRKENSNHLDFEKLKDKINEAFEKCKWFDLILTDFDLNEPGNVDGLEVVDYIKSRKKNVKIIMYSGDFSKAVRRVIRGENGLLLEQQIVDAVKKLIDYQIVNYVDRSSYVDEAISFFKKNKEFSIRDEFLKLLYAHHDMVFNSCFPDFAGKKFGEIAEVIDNGSDARSDEWMLAMIQQTIAYLAKVNE